MPKLFLKMSLIALTAAAAAAAGMTPKGFSFAGVANRVATPNGDTFNDTITFRFNNSRDSGGAIRVYTLRGRQVAVIDISGSTTSAEWDPRGHGGGVYIYVLSIEDRVYSGAVLVIQ